MNRKLSIIIPAYNEGDTIHLILDRVKETNLINNIVKEIIIINDCSTDQTEHAVKNYIYIVYRITYGNHPTIDSCRTLL